MWYPEASLRVNSFIFKTEKALYHSFPGFVVDALAVLRGKKPFLVSNLRIGPFPNSELSYNLSLPLLGIYCRPSFTREPIELCLA